MGCLNRTRRLLLRVGPERGLRIADSVMGILVCYYLDDDFLLYDRMSALLDTLPLAIVYLITMISLNFQLEFSFI